MTYEDLFVVVDQHAATIPPSALRLLVHLISRCIKDGSNEIVASTYTLTRDVGISRDTIRSAVTALTGILQVKSGDRVAYSFTLPPYWFAQQRGLFAPHMAVDNSHPWPGNQARSGLETRPGVDEKPGYDWPGNQASSGNLAWKPGYDWPGNQASLDQSGLETRLENTQNQQLSDHDPHRIESVVSSSVESIGFKIDQIVCAKVVPAIARGDARQLSDMLYQYMQQYGPPDRDEGTPDEQILARCVAVAPLGDLTFHMRQLHRDGTRCGRNYSWFVTTFANRICKIKPDALRDALRHAYKLNNSRPKPDLQFSEELTHQVASKVRRFA